MNTQIGLKTVQLHINKAEAKSEIKRQCLLLWAITSLFVIQTMFHICSEDFPGKGS